jgi:putative membrane protein
MKIKILSFTLALGLAMGVCSAQAQESHHHRAGLTDALFVKKAGSGGLTEVQLGQLAQQNGSTQEVKDFGAKMVTDHGKINDDLKTIAAKDNLTLPTQPNAEQQALIGKLTKETGKEFDTNYIHAMVKAHIADKALFTQEAQGAKNPDLAQFAQSSLPVIQEHLSMIQSIAGSGSSASAKSGGMNMGSSGDSGQGKSGVAPGANANPVPDTITDSPNTNVAPTTPDVGTSGESKSGLAPGSNANPVPATSPQP